MTVGCKPTRRDGRTEGRRDGGTEGRRDGGTEGRRDGGTEGRRDGGTEGRRDGGTEGRRDGGTRTEGRRDGGKEGRRDGSGTEGRGRRRDIHLTRCLRTLRARLQSTPGGKAPLVAARGAREGLWLEQGGTGCPGGLPLRGSKA